MPKTIFVLTEGLLPEKLQKDLQEREVVCETCKGLGVVVDENRYGLKDEKHPLGILFPYVRQSLHYCPDCYNGVRRLCKYCGKPGTRMYIHPETNCKCDGAQKARDEERRQEALKKYDAAEKIAVEEAVKRGIEMFFIDTFDRYVEPDDLDCEISELLSDDPDLDIVVYGTQIKTLKLDAGDIIAQECESQELHESVFESIGDKQTKELQELLDKWTAENAHYKTYWPDYNIVIVTERPVTP